MKIPNAAFLSSTLRYDLAAHVVVFERLDPATGEVAFQVPSPAALQEEERSAPVAANEGITASEDSSIARSDPSAGNPPAAPSQRASVGLPRISLLV